MPRIVRTSTAQEDALEIWAYIAEDNPDAATTMLERVDAAFRILAENPTAGRLRRDLTKNLRSFPVGNYIIFYRPIEDGIVVVRVLHGAMDLSEFF